MLPRAAAALRSSSWHFPNRTAPHLSAVAQSSFVHGLICTEQPPSYISALISHCESRTFTTPAQCRSHHQCARQPSTTRSPFGFAWRATFSRQLSDSAPTTLQQKTSISATARALLVDTLDMVRNLERVGLTRQQAELLTEHLTEVLCTHKEKLSQAFVTKAMLEKSLLEQDAQQAGFKSEIYKAQDMHVTTLNRESDRLSNDVLKVRSDIKYEVDKLTAGQRLDLNLEKGRMRDELQALRDKSNELEIQIDKEINALKAAVELTKNETIKYSLGLMFGLLTIGLGVIRLLV